MMMRSQKIETLSFNGLSKLSGEPAQICQQYELSLPTEITSSTDLTQESLIKSWVQEKQYIPICYYLSASLPLWESLWWATISLQQLVSLLLTPSTSAKPLAELRQWIEGRVSGSELEEDPFYQCAYRYLQQFALQKNDVLHWLFHGAFSISEYKKHTGDEQHRWRMTIANALAGALVISSNQMTDADSTERTYRIHILRGIHIASGGNGLLNFEDQESFNSTL